MPAVARQPGFTRLRSGRLAPEEIAADQAWFNAMLMIALILTIVAVFAVKLLAAPLTCAVVVLVLLALEWSQDRALASEAPE